MASNPYYFSTSLALPSLVLPSTNSWFSVFQSVAAVSCSTWRRRATAPSARCKFTRPSRTSTSSPTRLCRTSSTSSCPASTATRCAGAKSSTSSIPTEVRTSSFTLSLVLGTLLASPRELYDYPCPALWLLLPRIHCLDS